VAKLGIHLLLIVFSVYSVLPLFWTALQSLKNVRQANSRTPLFIFDPTFSNYGDLWLESTPENFARIGMGILIVSVLLVLVAVFARTLPVPKGAVYLGVLAGFAIMISVIPRIVDTAEFYDYFVNTLIVTVSTVVVSVSIGCLAGYALARYRGITGLVILIAALGFRALPRMAFVLPFFWLGRATGLHDTLFLLTMTLVAVNQPFTIWMLRSFFMDIPKELEESAMVDGANRFTAFRFVIVPIMWPGIVSTALFTLLLAYNEFLLARVLTQSNWTLPVAIAQFTGGEDPGHITLASAAAVSATIPIVIVILFFQKQLVKGLAAGAVKG
ncbi:MAG: carbohydrate ABC transporter permease, partial [Deinococcota bacterium]